GPQPAAAAEPAEARPPRDAAELAVELERLRDRWLRARADLENYRRRSEQKIELRVGDARDRLLMDWLEVVDSVDRALQLDQGSGAEDGLRAVLEQMQAVLARHGVRRMAAKGEPFDPELHEAVGVQAGDEVPPNTVVGVARAGYTVDDRVLRPAQVIVSRRPAEEEGAAG
ncbi:MAG: nucleotide exchange factor GrpE, partial [Solirubrobacteraceae bacterium]